MTQKEKCEEAKRLYETANADQRYVLESLFPELKESEDEKIKEALIQLVKCNERSGYFVLNNVSTGSMIDWIEKQGYSPIKWNKNTEGNKPQINHYF